LKQKQLSLRFFWGESSDSGDESSAVEETAVGQEPSESDSSDDEVEEGSDGESSDGTSAVGDESTESENENEVSSTEEGDGDNDDVSEGADESDLSDGESEVESSGVDDALSDTGDDDEDAELSVITMSLSLPVTMDAFTTSLKEELRLVVAAVADVSPADVTIQRLRPARRLLAGLLLDIAVSVPSPRRDAVLAQLSEDNLNDAARASPLPVLRDMQPLSVVSPPTSTSITAVGGSSTESGSGSSDDDDDLELEGGALTAVLAASLAAALGALGACIWCRTRPASSGPAAAAVSSNPEAALFAEPVTVPVGGRGPSYLAAKDQGLCYPVTAASAPPAMLFDPRAAVTPASLSTPPTGTQLVKVVTVHTAQ